MGLTSDVEGVHNQSNKVDEYHNICKGRVERLNLF